MRTGFRITSILLMLLLCAVTLCACTVPGMDRVEDLMQEDTETASEMSAEIVRCLTEGDRDSFADLFCEEIRKRDTFDEEVEAVFAFFSCDVYLTAQLDNMAGGERTVENKKCIRWLLRGKIPYIEVLPNIDEGRDIPKNRYYGAEYVWMLTDEEHPERIGLHRLTLSLLNTDESVTVGTEQWLSK